MANYQLIVEQRNETGKSYARKLRANEKIPAVIYGQGKQAVNIEAAVRDVEKALASHGSLIDLDLGGAKKTVIVKDVRRDPVRGTLQHMDFHEVDLSKKLETTVPIRVVGEEERGNDGGIVQVLLWEVAVLCLPTDIPDAIEVDVKNLALEQLISVGELQLPAGVEALTDADEAVVKINVRIQTASDEEEAAETPEETAAEAQIEE